jgi:hypothetical protein
MFGVIGSGLRERNGLALGAPPYRVATLAAVVTSGANTRNRARTAAAIGALSGFRLG